MGPSQTEILTFGWILCCQRKCHFLQQAVPKDTISLHLDGQAQLVQQLRENKPEVQDGLWVFIKRRWKNSETIVYLFLPWAFYWALSRPDSFCLQPNTLIISLELLFMPLPVFLLQMLSARQSEKAFCNGYCHFFFSFSSSLQITELDFITYSKPQQPLFSFHFGPLALFPDVLVLSSLA